MSGPTPNPSGCCGMVVSCCLQTAPDIVTATVVALCGTFQGTLIGQGSGANSGCWVGSVAMQLKNQGFPPTCVNKTLNFTLCCAVMGNMILTVDCGGTGSGSAPFPGPVACNPMDLTYLNVPLPNDCNSMESSLQSVEVKGQLAG